MEQVRLEVRPKKTRRILIFLSLVLTLLYFGLRLLLNSILGWGLIAGFSAGTDCTVTLSNPKLSFFPLRGSVDNVVIRHPSEADTAGFRAGHIAIKLDFLPLFKKRAILRDLEISEASAVSAGNETGFLNTLHFVTGGTTAAPAATPAATPWHGFLSRNWDLFLTNLTVQSAASSTPDLVISTGSNIFEWDGISLSLTIDPRIDAPNIMAGEANTFNYRNGTMHPMSFGRLKAKALLTSGTVEFPYIVATPLQPRNDRDAIEIQGKLHHHQTDAYDFSVKAALSSDYGQSVFPFLAYSSLNNPALVIAGAVTGAIDKPSFAGTVAGSLEQPLLKSGSLDCTIKNATADFKLDETGLFLKQINIENLTREASFKLRFDSLLTLSVNGIIASSPEAEMFSRCFGDLHQQQETPATVAGVTVESASGILSVEGHLTPLKLQGKLHDFSLITSAGTVSGEITLASTLALDGKLRLGSLQLRQIPLLRQYFPFATWSMAGSVIISGSLTDPALASSLTIAHGEFPKQPPQSKIAAEINRQGLNLSGILYDERGRVELRYPFQGELPFSVSGALSDVPLDALFALTPPEQRGEGRLTMNYDYQAPRSTPTLGKGQITVTELFLQQGESTLTHQQPLLFSIKIGELHIDQCRLALNEGTVELTGMVGLQTGWNAQLLAQGTIRGFAANMVDEVSGDLNGTINISGPASNPTLAGPLTLRNGSIAVALGKSIVGANQIEIDSHFSGDMLTVQRIEGRVGAGLLTGAGTLEHILSRENRFYEITINLSDIALEPIDHLSLELGSSLRILKMPGSPLTVLGDVEFHNATYEDTVNLREILLTLTKRVLGLQSRSVASAPTSSDIVLDLHLRGDDSLLIDTNIIQAELATNLHATGTPKRLHLQGEMKSLDGMFLLQSSTFDIIRGKLIFPEEATVVDPTLDIIGETVVTSQTGDQYQVQITISGTLTKPRVELSSNSGLTEKDLISLLTFGGQLQEVSLFGLGTSKRPLSYDQLLDRKSRIGFEEGFSGVTGFSSVTLNAISTTETGEYVPVLTAKRPLTDKTTATIRSEIGARSLHQADVGYTLSPHLNLIGGWRSYPATEPELGSGNFSLGLEYSRTFPGLTLLPQTLSKEKR